MSKGKFIIGGIFVCAAIIGTIPLFFHDYKKITNNLSATQNATETLEKAPLSNNKNDVLGKFNNTTLKRSDLNPQERQTLYDAENQSYKAIENILAKRFFDNRIKEYMKKKNISNVNDAEKIFIQEFSGVSQTQVKQFIKENAENPQLKGKSPEQQEALVKPYLQNQGISNYYRSIIAKAISDGDIEVTGVTKPESVRINVDTSNAPSKGTANAPITIVEFADFQCPFCATAEPVIEEVLKKYKGKVRLVFKNFPLAQMHPEAIPSALAAECAAKQDKYWLMHGALFDNHKKLNEQLYVQLAQKFGLNLEEFNKCRKDKAMLDKIYADIEYGQSLGINATPAFYVNGIQLMGAVPKSDFEKIINSELAK
jgi:protein-disulfide isomerase